MTDRPRYTAPMPDNLRHHMRAGAHPARSVPCGHCGARGLLAECAVYLGGPGVVVRCRVCHTIVMVLVEVREMMCVDLGGLSDLEVPAWRSWPSDSTIP